MDPAMNKDKDEEFELYITDRLPYADGLYIKGTVGEIEVHFTMDTGSSKTILSSRVYNQMEQHRKPSLGGKIKLKGAGGKDIPVLGAANFEMTMGSLKISWRMIVADIEDDVLLGIDLLQADKADLLLSQGIVRIHGHSIPYYGSRRRGTLRLVETCIVPSLGEVVVPGFVDRDMETCDQGRDLVFEPSTEFMEKNSVLVASAIVNTVNRVTVPIRILNPTEQDVKLYPETMIGEMESCEVFDFDDVNKEEITVQTTKEDNIPEHLKELYEESIVNLKKEEREKFREFLWKFQDTFSRHEWDLGQTTLINHEINTEGHRPVKQPPRKVPLALDKETREIIQNLQDKGIIRPSNSPWSSPLVLAKKKNGKLRLCVDYRKVNSLTTKDAFPLPRIQDCLDSVSGARWFSTLDLTAGYHQVKVKESDIPKTAFVTKYGHFEYTTMPFGLTNAPGTFQKLMELALAGLQWNTCLIYLDDVIIFSRDAKEHLTRLEHVVEKIKQAGLKLKPEKCQMFQEEVIFLGHRVNKDGILPDKSNIQKIVDWSRPTTPTEVKQFLGTATYYRRFVKGFSAISKPLTELTQKDKPFHWTSECQQAFDKLKNELIGPEIMGVPDPEQGDFILDCDACDVGIGGVLSQIQDGRERVLYYGSRTLNKSERNYCVTDKELLAVRYFVDYFRQYLLGRHFLVRTDHQALVWLFRLKDPKGRVARWIEILSAFNFSIEYRPGNRHGNADGLSRCPNPFDCTCPDMDNLEKLKCGPCSKCQRKAAVMDEQVRKVKTRKQSAVNELPGETTVVPRHSHADIRNHQNDDEDIGPVLRWKTADEKPATEM
ncbi:hypothetical protein FSP39_025347 [Pinctada imbricata]|uniref:RNA-directed DNA polymerase n=1 Tax=Pinctada imbricata TaxID=66713 RepID=A0AA88XQU8_PINIB|nr:hypothetical protein FSP39_025347 [Pinctada imbricata]